MPYSIRRARGAGRFEWTVLQWNEKAIAFYRELGAEVQPDYRVCRISFGNSQPPSPFMG